MNRNVIVLDSACESILTRHYVHYQLSSVFRSSFVFVFCRFCDWKCNLMFCVVNQLSDGLARIYLLSNFIWVNWVSFSGVQTRNPFSHTAYVKITFVILYLRIRKTCKNSCLLPLKPQHEFDHVFARFMLLELLELDSCQGNRALQ